MDRTIINAFALIHGSIEPIIYGLTIFVGLLVTLNKLLNLKILSFICDVGVFYLVFSLHGHSMTGGFAATIAALLSGIVFPYLIRKKLK